MDKTSYLQYATNCASNEGPIWTETGHCNGRLEGEMMQQNSEPLVDDQGAPVRVDSEE